jgi:hypothetical protein
MINLFLTKYTTQQLKLRYTIESLSVLTYNYFKRFFPFESSGDIVHIEKSGCFNVDVVLKPLFMRVGELSDDICNRLDSEITMKVTISKVPWCVNNTI